jgi:hypothetical protein
LFSQRQCRAHSDCDDLFCLEAGSDISRANEVILAEGVKLVEPTTQADRKEKVF